MSAEHRLPVSVKGVLGPPGQVVLLRNERDEWELPGGRLEQTDDGPPTCLSREIREELGLEVGVGDPLHSWLYEPVPDRVVLLIAYDCTLVGEWPERLGHSSEHSAVGLFSIESIGSIALPRGYRDAIARSRVHGSSGAG